MNKLELLEELELVQDQLKFAIAKNHSYDITYLAMKRNNIEKQLKELNK